MKLRQTSGFSIIEVGIVIIVVGLIGLLGVVGYNRWQADQTKSAQESTTQTASVASEVPAVNTTKDLDKVTEILDNTNLDSDYTTDSKKLDEQSSAF